MACSASETITVRSGSSYAVSSSGPSLPTVSNRLYRSWSSRWMDIPTQCNKQAAAITTSASRSLIPKSATTLGVTPRLNRSRASRSAMFRTIWMWTQEWSDIPSRRVALTADTCHHALTWSSALTASRRRSSLRFPRVGARIRISAKASLEEGAGAGP